MAGESLSDLAAIALASSCRTGTFSKPRGPRNRTSRFKLSAIRLLAERGIKADPSMMSRFFRKIGVAFKNVWPAPSASGLSRVAVDQSASTYPASKVVLPAKMEIRAPRS